MENFDRWAFPAGVGAIGAILLGMVLVPLRGLTPAANFTFAFMALTIVIAEIGGRRAAVATALTSALSLDFFLTRPYLKLTIADKHDLIAFLGLTGCGLVAAAFGSARDRRRTAAVDVRVLEELIRELTVPGDTAAVLSRMLEAVQPSLPVSALLARNEQQAVVAATPGATRHPSPSVALPRDADQPGGSFTRREPLPGKGGRIELVSGSRTVGVLEVWGDGRPATPEERRLLWDLARCVSARLAMGGAVLGGDGRPGTASRRAEPA